MGITEITGTIAVVVSVLYLGLQIRDNTKVLRSQALERFFSVLTPGQPVQLPRKRVTLSVSGQSRPRSI